MAGWLIYLSICLSVCLSVCLSACLSVCLSIYISVQSSPSDLVSTVILRPLCNCLVKKINQGTDVNININMLNCLPPLLLLYLVQARMYEINYTDRHFLLLKPGFHLDFFCLLLLVLVFRTNRKPQRAMRCSNGNIHKKPKRATKSHNEQQKAFACFGF